MSSTFDSSLAYLAESLPRDVRDPYAVVHGAAAAEAIAEELAGSLSEAHLASLRRLALYFNERIDCLSPLERGLLLRQQHEGELLEGAEATVLERAVSRLHSASVSKREASDLAEGIASLARRSHG